MKLSTILFNAARFGRSPSNSGFLRDCAGQARELEEGIQGDVRLFHITFGHDAPVAPVSVMDSGMLEFRIARIEEECKELVEAIRERSLAKIAAEAVDLIYVVVGTLVALGLPLMPFWKDVHRANMSKEYVGPLTKPTKPEGWVGPDPHRVLYNYKTNFMDDRNGPEMG
tara:strand:- start:1711 stop:2217 length:507 start_codon:yes stop_codon:yes gene_type:complete